jgi:hypothetical protein
LLRINIIYTLLIKLIKLISHLLKIYILQLFFIEDDNALAAKARASAKNALAQVKEHTRIFDGERKAQYMASSKSSDLSLSSNDCKLFFIILAIVFEVAFY